MLDKSRDVPVDRGWAWMIVIGYFTSIFCMVGIGKSFGILLAEIGAHFDTPVAVTSLIMGVYGGIYTLAAPICVSAGTQFGHRRVVMAGGLLGAAGLCLAGLLVSIEWVIVVVGLLFGVGNGSIFGNGLVMINQYFDRRRSLAHGLSLAGASIGQFAIPPLLQYLLDMYSLQGALIVVGGIYLHVMVCGALYRPMAAYREKSRKIAFLGAQSRIRETKKESLIHRNNIIDNSDSQLVNDEQNSVEMKLILKPYKRGTSINRQSNNGSPEIETKGSCQVEDDRIPTNYAITTIDFFSDGSMTRGLKQEENIYNDCVSSSQEEGATLKFNKQADNIKQTNYISNCKSCFVFRTFIAGLLDFSALKNSVALLFVAVSFLLFFGHFNFILFMPQTAFRRGVSNYEKAYLVSINGLCDLLGRISVGYLGDLKILKRYKLLALTSCLCGASILGFALCRSFMTMAACAGLYGFFGGGYVVINMPTLIDLVGQVRMPGVLGAMLFIQGIGAAVGQPVLGAVRDVTGSYYAVHVISGLAMMLGATLLMFYPLVRKNESRT